MQNMEGCLFTSGNYTKQMSLNLKPMGFFWGGREFTSCKAGQPLQGMELQEKETRKI